jgi:VanZ family protein
VPSESFPRRFLASLRNPRIALSWAAVAGWMAFVWWLGSSEFGMAGDSRYLIPFLRWLLPDHTYMEILPIAAQVRKLAHPSIYGVLAGLLYHATRVSGMGPPLRAAVVALALSLAVAGCDEARQSLLAERTGSWLDVLLDGGGAIAVLTASLAAASLRPRRRPLL